MATYWKANKEIHALADSVLREFHIELSEAGVELTVLMAQSKVDEKTGLTAGPAVKAHGYPAAAVIKITNPVQRILGAGDAIVTLCCDSWGDLSREQQIALIDHELEHLELVKDKDGNVKEDDYGRPRLKIRSHDWQVGGFDSVIRRHGPNAVEMLVVQDMLSEERPVRQSVFSWG